MFFKAKTDADSIKEQTGGGKYISKSGIYDVTIHTAFMGGTEKSPVVELFVNYNDQDQPIYGQMRLLNNDGSENFGALTFNKLLVIADIDEVSDPIDGELPIGKKGVDKDVAILEDIQDIECKVRIQMEYGVYNGNITEKTVIKNFYRTDGASAEEVVNDTEVGIQLEKDTPYAENITYKDVTAEAVTQWISDKRPKGTAGASTASSTPATKRPSFGRKK